MMKKSLLATKIKTKSLAFSYFSLLRLSNLVLVKLHNYCKKSDVEVSKCLWLRKKWVRRIWIFAYFLVDTSILLQPFLAKEIHSRCRKCQLEIESFMQIFLSSTHVIGCQFDMKLESCTRDFSREHLQKSEPLKERYMKTIYVSKETINTLIKPFFSNNSRILTYTRVVIYIGKTVTHTVSSSIF